MIQQPAEHFLNNDMECCKNNSETLRGFWETAREGEWWVGLVLAVLKDRVYFHLTDGHLNVRRNNHLGNSGVGGRKLFE